MGQALEMCIACKTPRDCDNCLDLHEWIMEHMEQRWVSVKDRMPPQYHPVIVHVRHTEKWRSGLSNQDTWHVVEDDIWLGDKWESNADDDIHEVTHWMPMPDPPEEEG